MRLRQKNCSLKKKRVSIIISANGVKYPWEGHKCQFWVPFYSTFSLITFSILYKTLIVATLVMIIHYIQLRIKRNFELLQLWFYENHMVLNPGKFYYLIINKDITNETIESNESTDV